MSAARPDAILIAKANAGVPQWHGAHIHYSGSPGSDGAPMSALAVDAGARIVGGCCGTTPAHLAAMRRALDEHTPGPPPERRSDRRGARPAGRRRPPQTAARARRRGRERS